jgi:glycosyltransferase involved in cell wall biosynthesis
MKVIISHSVPFSLCHGGFQTLIEAIMKGLGGLGVEIEPERWWDEGQKGDVLQYFGRPTGWHVEVAKAKGYRVAMFETLDCTASRSNSGLLVQRQMIKAGRIFLKGFTARFGWEVYQLLDAMIYAVPREWDVAKKVFGARPDRGWVIPHGLDKEALASLAQSQKQGDYLISIATVHQRKNTVLLARAAKLAKVPVVFLGKPYWEKEEYYQQFRQEVDDRFVIYRGFVPAEKKMELLRGAKGFVHLSQYESGCIAVHEAAAAGLPLLLSDLPWATAAYPRSEDISFVRIGAVERVASSLRQFYERASRRSHPVFPVLSWDEVAIRYQDVYRQILSR